MSIIESLKSKIDATNDAPLADIGQPMLDRISDRVSGGASAVWCRATWGSSCDLVNIQQPQL